MTPTILLMLLSGWIQAAAHFTGTGRLLLFKGFRIDQEMVYSDYRKFSVESGFKIQGAKQGPRTID